MRIVVCIKHVPDVQSERRIEDGRLVRGEEDVLNELDENAVEAAVCLAEDADGEVIALTMGPEDAEDGVRRALQMGADSGVVVADDATAGWNATKTASALAELVKSVEGADILLAGDSSIDEGTKIVPALVAGFLGWPAFQGVSAVVKTADGYEITQNVPGGTRTIAVSGPVVVSASSDAVAPKVPSMKDILAAGKKPVEKAEVPSVDVEITVVGRSKPERKARKNKIFEGADAPAQLVAALRADGVL